jgi:hypothetical protein
MSSKKHDQLPVKMNKNLAVDSPARPNSAPPAQENRETTDAIYSLASQESPQRQSISITIKSSINTLTVIKAYQKSSE